MWKSATLRILSASVCLALAGAHGSRLEVQQQQVRFAKNRLGMKTYAYSTGQREEVEIGAVSVCQCDENGVTLKEYTGSSVGRPTYLTKAVAVRMVDYDYLTYGFRVVDLRKASTSLRTLRGIYGLVFLEEGCVASEPTAPWKEHVNIYYEKTTMEDGIAGRNGLRLTLLNPRKPPAYVYTPVHEPRGGLTFVATSLAWEGVDHRLTVLVGGYAEPHATAQKLIHTKTMDKSTLMGSRCSVRRGYRLKEIELFICPDDENVKMYHKQESQFRKAKQAAIEVGFVYAKEER